MIKEQLVMNNVSFKYPQGQHFALQNINLSVMEGEFLAVMGENGAGKTTLCKLINGIIPHISKGMLSGTVTAAGCLTTDFSVSQLALKVGMVLDDPDAQLLTSTVRNEAAFGPENLCFPEQEIERLVKDALVSVGLCGFEDRAPVTLSGGEKQRLSIAASLAMKGKILVLDEPLCRLDPQGVQEVMSVLKEIKEKYKLTIIMTEHNSKMIYKYADRVCILNKGCIVSLDTPEKIFANPELLEENGISSVKENEKIFVETKPPLNPVIDIKGFSYFYNDGISIEDINLSFAENDFAAITGSNGCGKTTLLKNITGLLRPCGGDILIRGKSVKKMPVSDISKEAGYVMQNPDSQLFTDSVYNEVAFSLKNKYSKTEIKQRVEEALFLTGLKDPDAYPHALSKADRTKTVIACVLAMGPKIMIFDEIDAGYDYKNNLQIIDIFNKLYSKGITVIFVTHNMFLANAAHRLIKMDRKGIIFDGRQN
ncbi:MAG: energy-coupling factor transporter ATPase [Treponema sp.]|nr:energy-coupling factor transporter ATPase [Treponema sp.]